MYMKVVIITEKKGVRQIDLWDHQTVLPCVEKYDPLLKYIHIYDSFSVEPIIWVRRGHESESGQMVLKKVKLTYVDAYLWQTMWNHAKKSMEESKHSDSVFLQWDCAENAKKTQKLEKLKRKLLKILKRYDLSRVVPCESWRPELSENVVVFENWRF